MRRLVGLILGGLLLAASGGLTTAPGTAQVGQVDRDRPDARRGLVYDGLQRVAQSDACRGNFRVGTQTHRGIPVCTHGPDPAPEGVDVLASPAPAVPAGTAAATQVPCIGNGTDGFRVHLLYARASDKADSYAQWLPSFQQYAARMDDVFNLSAAETGGTRHVRFVHDAACVPVIDNVVLSSRGDDNFDNMLSELRSKGYSRSDRKYLVWMDANVYCGIGQIYYDDVPGQENTSNGQSWVPGEVGRVDRGCWGQTNLVEVHELVHTLGGVQTSAPNATPGNHCTDNYDRLCYSDGTGTAEIVCGDSGHENRLDCNHDDYYSTAPPAGSYLDTHWNVANSRFLVGTGGGGPGTTTTTTRPPPSTTSTTSRFPSWWPTTTSRPPITTTTTRPPTTTTTTTASPTTTTTTTTPPGPTTTTTTTAPPPVGVKPSAPQMLVSSQPASGALGVALSWSAPSSPGSPPFTTYRIYRGATATSLAPIADVPAGTRTFIDSSAASRLVYWYYVVAVNPAGESPPSNLTRMIAR